MPDCNQMFVRPDLLARHKKRHSDSYVPRNRASSFSIPPKESEANTSLMSPPDVAAAGLRDPRPALPQVASAPRNASVLLAAESPRLHPPTATLPSLLPQGQWSPMDAPRIKPVFYDPGTQTRDQLTFSPFPQPAQPSQPGQSTHSAQPGHGQPGVQAPGPGLCDWLFNPHQTGDSSVAKDRFVGPEGGLESTFNQDLDYEQESLASGRSQIDLTPPQQSDTPDDLLSESRRQDIVRWVCSFRQKRTTSEPALDVLLQEHDGDIPGLGLEVLRNCVRQYWALVSPRIPIVHEPTFSPNRCSIFLLLVMTALGAAQIYNQAPHNQSKEYGALADLIIWYVRSEILNTEDASPPVELWAAQALLLLEFYEKMYSSRKLHERAHIYHPLTLNLLRRGSPLIGGAGSESPPDAQNGEEHPATSDARTSWTRWADTEAMHRVVFTAFMMDIIHAAMFGHAADMAPHEIRLLLPCDDELWSAPTPEILRQRVSSSRMSGFRKPISFLDGLKNAIHGREVRTHSFGRMIIMCGLLSVGWHLRHRDTHLKWLESSPSSAHTREKWCRMLLQAFDHWKNSFDQAMGRIDSEADGSGQSGSNGLVQSAAVLYHLAHISLYVDIVDCQVFARATRLLGRKVSTRDYANVVQRMKAWAAQYSTRLAVFHAFRLLYRVLVDPLQKRGSYQNSGSAYGVQYSCRNDPDPHRPWVVYYATLSIWSFVRALGLNRPPFSPPLPRVAGGIYKYLSNVAIRSDLDVSTSRSLLDGLPELLDAIGVLSSESHSEILQEAQGRLEVCKEMLATGAL